MLSAKVHLVVVHHGLWGTPENTAFLTTRLAKYHGGQATAGSKLVAPESTTTLEVHASTHANAAREVRMVVLNSSVNASDHTYDGVDWCAERLVGEIYGEIERMEQSPADSASGSGAQPTRVVKLSLVGYSLGGLVVRYAAGLMYTDGVFAASPRSQTKLPFSSRPTAASLSTIATPHLGIAATGSTFSKLAQFVGARMLGRSGRQLYLADRGWMPPDSGSSTSHPDAQSDESQAGLCLLEALVDDRFSFFAALRLFARIDIYANAVADLTVPYRTAAFEPYDPFIVPDAVALVRDTQHPVLLTSYAARTPERQPLWKRVSSSLSPNNLPWILNPQRLPFRFPLNYAAWIGLPVLLPVMLALVLHKLRSDSRVSNRRVAGFERKWAIDHGHLPASETNSTESGEPGVSGERGVKPLDRQTMGRLERKRVARLLAHVEADAEEAIRELGEDYVDKSPTESTPSLDDPLEVDDETRYVQKSNAATLSLSQDDEFKLSKHHKPLSATQLRIAAKLNDPSLLPQLNKHLAHFDNVLNAHAVIIVRSTTIEAHKKGIPLINAFVQRFPL